MSDNNFVKDITNIEDDFAKWYTDIVIKAELVDYTDVKGFIAYRPLFKNMRMKSSRNMELKMLQCQC